MRGKHPLQCKKLDHLHMSGEYRPVPHSIWNPYRRLDQFYQEIHLPTMTHTLAFSSIGIVLSVDFQHIKTMRKVINQCLGLSKYVASAKKFCDDISIAHMHIYAHIYAPNTIE